MWRFLLIVLCVCGGMGAWYVYANYQIEIRRGTQGGFEMVKLVPRVPAGTVTSQFGDPVPAAGARTAIRIGSFNLDGFDEAKLANPQVSDALVRILSRLEVVALQGIHTRSQAVLIRLVELINASGRHYDFAVCPLVERDGAADFAAILFDLAAVEIDRSTVHSVEDPARRLQHKPLCASFRVRGPAAAEAFTFTLISAEVDPNRAAAELDCLAAVFRAVRDDERHEDDIILLGSLQTDPEHLGRLALVPNLAAAIAGVPTTTRGTRMADNLLFDRRATVEFTGRAAVFDTIRELDLSPQTAVEVSEHLPVWAEFSAYEGGQAGHTVVADSQLPR